MMRRYARSALVHDLPVMMPATPPKAAVSSTSTPDAFISVPMHPKTTSAYASFRDAAPEISSGKGRSIAQDMISDKAVGRLIIVCYAAEL